MSKINDPIVGSFEGLLVYVTPITTRPDGRRAKFYTIVYQGPLLRGGIERKYLMMCIGSSPTIGS